MSPAANCSRTSSTSSCRSSNSTPMPRRRIAPVSIARSLVSRCSPAFALPFPPVFLAATEDLPPMKRMSRIILPITVAIFATPLVAASQVVTVSDAGVSVAVGHTSIMIPSGVGNTLETQADTALRSAKQVLDDGDYREAARLFLRIAERYPRSAQAADALYYRAYALFRAGGNSSLSSALQSLEELNRNYPSSAANRGDAGPLRIRICGELARRGDEAC